MTLLALLLSDAPIPQNVFDKFKSIEWNIYPDAPDYIDLETDIPYKKSLTNTCDSLSFNLNATIDIQYNKLYFVFGENAGRGFDDKCAFRYAPNADMGVEFDKALDECEAPEFKALMRQYPDQVKAIKERLIKLIQLLVSDLD